MSNNKKRSNLSKVVYDVLVNYFEEHDTLLPVSGLYNLVISEVEQPLLFLTLKFVGGNQKKAAQILGINRNTLRKKLTTFLKNSNSVAQLNDLVTSIEEKNELGR
jgi:DNA-binding protein Fis